MQRPRSLQLTFPTTGPTAAAAASSTATPAAATPADMTVAPTPAVEVMEENELVTSPGKSEPGSSGGDHVRTPTNDITNIANAFPGPAGSAASTVDLRHADSAELPYAATVALQPVFQHPLMLAPAIPSQQLQPPPHSQRPARPSSLLLVTPAGQWTPLPPASASAAASPSVALRQKPPSRRPNSLCLPSKWQPSATGPSTPLLPQTPPLPSPSIAQRRPQPSGAVPPGVDVPPIKRLRPSTSGLLGFAFPAPVANFAMPATPSSEMPPSPFPPPTPLTPSSMPSSTCMVQSPVEDAEMVSPTSSFASSTTASIGGAAEASSGASGFVLGVNKPYWVPDRDAPLCMQCGARFTVLRRRHHCRACGRVFCSACASHTARLAFLGDAKARVCAICHQQLTAPRPPLPRPQLTSASIAATAVASSSRPLGPPPVVGVLKAARGPQTSQQPSPQSQQQPQPPPRPRSVVFSDGVRPGGGRDLPPTTSTTVEMSTEPSAGLEASWVPPDGWQLPPCDPQVGGQSVEAALRSGRTVGFRICRSVRVTARLLPSLPCCATPGTSWWLLVSSGLYTVGQAEVFLLLQRPQPRNQPDEAVDSAQSVDSELLPPAHAFALIYSVYERAFSGAWVRHLSFLTAPKALTGPLLGDRSHAGILFFRLSRLHCTLHLNLPQSQPLLCGLLVLRWEAPWAELFPLRLLLRLGCEHRTYPYPLISVPGRSPVFGEISGRSLVGMLVDARNFTHGLPNPPGLTVQLRTGCTTIRCPTTAYAAVQKALTAAVASDGVCRVLAFGAEFCSSADAHLVCHQNLETGEYGTRAISIESRQLSVTAGSFVVFNGGAGFAQNRASIVEDGVLVQLTEEQMGSLRDALRSMRAWSAVCSSDSSGDLVEFVWTGTDEDTSGVRAAGDAVEEVDWLSLIDGRPLGRDIRTVPVSASVRGGSGCGGAAVRWTRMHALREADLADGSPADGLRCASRLAAAVTASLSDLSDDVIAAGGFPVEFAVRIAAGPAAGGAAVWEAAGRGGHRLPAGASRLLEVALRPALTELAGALASDMSLELVFVCLPVAAQQAM